MRRREFVSLLGGAAAWPLAARGQQPKMPVVAFFAAGSPTTSGHLAAAFEKGLRESGFVDGQNVAIEYRWAEDQYDRLPMLAADIVRRPVAVIAAGPRAVDAAKSATTSIPIVFMSGSDPVRLGYASSLNRPGGNLTGVTILAQDLTAKRFGLLHEAVPAAKIMGVLFDASPPPRVQYAAAEAQTAAQALGVQTRVMGASNESETESAFATFAREGVEALFVVNGFLFFSVLRTQLVELAMRYRIPASYELRQHVEAGGLMSYGPSAVEAYSQVGRYTGRILKGEKPADLPVQLPTKFEFMLNLKTAKALNLTIPPGILAIADEVIE